MMQTRRHAVRTGVLLMVVVTLLSTGADAVMKAVAGSYDAPQVLFLAALAALVLTFGANRGQPAGRIIATDAPVAMAVRAVATLLAAVGFFHAFRLLPFAEVFLFIGAMPLLAAALSGPILQEPVGLRTWTVLGIGFSGLICLFPTGPEALSAGHGYAALGGFAGTLSIVLSRWIGRHGTHSLAQVFWPQALMALIMAGLLPWVIRPMTAGDVALILGYAALVFAARWLLVVVLQIMPAWLALQLINLQFVWMVLIGTTVFHEATRPLVFVGAALVALAGIVLAHGEMRARHGAGPDASAPLGLDPRQTVIRPAE